MTKQEKLCKVMYNSVRKKISKEFPGKVIVDFEQQDLKIKKTWMYISEFVLENFKLKRNKGK